MSLMTELEPMHHDLPLVTAPGRDCVAHFANPNTRITQLDHQATAPGDHNNNIKNNNNAEVTKHA